MLPKSARTIFTQVNEHLDKFLDGFVVTILAFGVLAIVLAFGLLSKFT